MLINVGVGNNIIGNFNNNCNCNCNADTGFGSKNFRNKKFSLKN